MGFGGPGGPGGEQEETEEAKAPDPIENPGTELGSTVGVEESIH